jgi:deoxyhypusine synthase
MNNYISSFIKKYFLHFNSLVVLHAAEAYKKHISQNGKMMITLAGAMSTAEIGKILAKMIRQNKVHIISCTGANLEEDIMNLIANSSYIKLPHYRELTSYDEKKLLDQGYNRVTDTCIPENEAFKTLENKLYDIWLQAMTESKSYFPHEFLFQLLKNDILKPFYQINPEYSWVLAALEKNVPIIVPGWEDSTIGNIFTSYCLKGVLSPSIIKSGIDYMIFLTKWYIKNSNNGVGFFQIGGGISGDFPISVVPLIRQDMGVKNIPLWSYYCQISDSTTSYGSYSGAVPNEKISWGKIGVDTPKFIIESDATIVTPLIFGYVLEM